MIRNKTKHGRTTVRHYIHDDCELVITRYSAVIYYNLEKIYSAGITRSHARLILKHWRKNVAKNQT